MGKSAQTPAPVDYDKLIPLQTAANKDVFNYALGASRVNSKTPFGTTTWSQTGGGPDQAAYEQALKSWNASNSAGTPGVPGDRTWVPGRPNIIGYNESGEVYGNPTEGSWQDTPGSAGTPGTSRGAPPKIEDFMTGGQWTQTQTLSPEQQQLYDADVQSKLGLSSLTDALLGNVRNATSSALPSDNQYNQELADAMYRQQTRYLDPQQSDLQRALETRLAEQGFVPGTPAYTQEMERFDRSNDLAYGDARDRSIAGGYRQGQTAFENALRLRSLPLSELNAVRTGAQPTIPGLGSGQNSVPGLSAVDLLGADAQRYGQELDLYNSKTGSQNALMGVLGQIGGALLGNPALGGIFSDPRLKTDIVSVGATSNGIPVYEWTYIWGGPRFRGVMAPDVPHAASRGADGFWRVDYRKVRP